MGANLIPMAASLPTSQFVGVDLSRTQVDLAHATIQASGVDNVEVLHRNILDIDTSLGKFDYVICHGVFSWVPQEVQSHILKICNELLSEQGIAYISYNTFPGWHLRGAIRHMMKYHVANFETPKQQIAQARHVLAFLAESTHTQFEAYPTLLKQEAENLSKKSDSYLFHDFLEPVNEPMYFHQFIEALETKELRYVADAEIRTMMPQYFEPEVAEKLKPLPLVQREQYMDFLRSRLFRASLVTHARQIPRYGFALPHLRPLHARLHTPCQATSGDDGQTIWKHARGEFKTQGQLTDVLQQLQSAGPNWVAMTELLSAAGDDAAQQQQLVDSLMGPLLSLGVLADSPPTLSTELNERPLASAVARLQASRGPVATNRCHHDVRLSRLTAFVLQQLDGNQTRQDIAALLKSAASDGTFQVSHQDRPVESVDEIDWTPIVEHELRHLRNACFLQ